MIHIFAFCIFQILAIAFSRDEHEFRQGGEMIYFIIAAIVISYIPLGVMCYHWGYEDGRKERKT